MNISTQLDYRAEGGKIVTEDVPAVNILSLFAYLFNHHGVYLDDAVVQKWWRHARDYLPYGKNHPAVLQGGHHVPIGVHGDEARYSSSGGPPAKVIAVSLSMPLWRPRSSRNSRFLIFVLRETLSLGKKSLFPVFDYIRWALNIMFEGVKPQSGYLGGILPHHLVAPDPASETWEHDRWICANKIKFALTELRGDWSWFYHAYNLRPHWVSAMPCFKCDVKGAGAPAGESYVDYSPNAFWCGNETSHVQFLTQKLHPGHLCASAGSHAQSATPFSPATSIVSAKARFSPSLASTAVC